MLILSFFINLLFYHFPDELALFQMMALFQTSWGKSQPTILIANIFLLYFPFQFPDVLALLNS